MCAWKKGDEKYSHFRQYLKDVSMGKHTFQRITFPWKNSTQQWDIDIAIYKQGFSWKAFVLHPFWTEANYSISS